MVVDITPIEVLANETSGAAMVCVVLNSVAERPLSFVITPVEDENATGMCMDSLK